MYVIESLDGRRVRPVPVQTMDESNDGASRQDRQRWHPNGTCCWHCCGELGDSPLPLPVKHDERRNTFDVTGEFCGFACALGYCRDSKMMAATGRRGIACYAMYRMMGGRARSLPCAPPRRFLKQFGGHLDLDEFRRVGNDTIYDEVPVNCITRDSVYRARPRQSVQSTQTIDYSKASVDAPTIRLRARGAPLPSAPTGGDKTLLQQCLGL